MEGLDGASEYIYILYVYIHTYIHKGLYKGLQGATIAAASYKRGAVAIIGIKGYPYSAWLL